eukprot:TRINITY_DN18241_c0_g1_i1.p1 TRINITY_DN18241_c0_g1~~TRINITY_DN18241_c0_g1_i1.p1  ORF type:complete len:467 (-),score=65.83 TRINITY_DN18241_c0_g1_i1:211-1611(-)
MASAAAHSCGPACGQSLSCTLPNAPPSMKEQRLLGNTVRHAQRRRVGAGSLGREHLPFTCSVVSGASLSLCSLAAAGSGRRKLQRCCRNVARNAKVDSIEDLQRLRVRDLRQTLQAAGIRTEGCFDKDSLLDLLKSDSNTALVAQHLAGGAPAGGQGSTKTPKPGVQEFALHFVKGADEFGVKADDDRYVTLDISIGAAGTATRFVLDTGASNTVLRDDAALRLNAQTLPVPVTAQGATGMQGGMRLVSVGRAMLGSFDCGEMQAVATQTVPVPFTCAGLLGLDFIRKFDWQLDIPRAVGAVTATGTGQSAFPVQGMSLLPLQEMCAASGFRLLATPLWLSKPGAPANQYAYCLAVVDFGAPMTICSQATAAQLGLQESDLRSTGRAVVGLDGNAMFVRETHLALTVGEDKTGPVKQNMEVIVGDLPIFGVWGLEASTPVAVLGLDFFQNSRVVMQPNGNQLWMTS